MNKMAKTVIVPTEGGTNPCFISKWNVKEGDTVSMGDMLCEAETDKSVLDILAPIDGTILKIIYGNDEMAPVLTPIAIIGNPGEDIEGLIPDKAAAGGAVETESKPETKLEIKPLPQISTPTISERTNSIYASPRAKRYAKEHNIDLTGITGTGFNGAIIERNVIETALRYVADVDTNKMAAKDDEYTVYRQTLTERTSAERLMSSLRQSAQTTMSTQANAEKMMSLRKRINLVGEKYGISRVTVNDMVLFATAQVLAEHSEINSVWSGEELHRYKHVHLGVAVDTERGLIVPVIRNADTMSLTEISVSARKLITAAREGKISAAQMSGGTFTVSNIGHMGIKTFTPIVNPPQVCILGVGAVEPAYCRDENGDIVETSNLTLNLTHDHRAVDGAPAARFLQELCDFIKDYDVMMVK